MDYKYITENNLEDKQSYMYSEFSGEDFLQAYLSSRISFIDSVRETALNDYHYTLHDLMMIRDKLVKEEYGDVKEMLDSYVKKFEISKRIYSEYGADWRCGVNASYGEIELYILLGESCLLAYSITNCLKYFSCLLKLGDTLISLGNKMTLSEKSRAASLLEKELEDYNELRICLGDKDGIK